MVPRSKSTKTILGGLKPLLGSRRSGSLGRHGRDLAFTDVRGFLKRRFFFPTASTLAAPHADDIPRASTPTLATPFSLDPHVSRLKHHN